MVGMNTGKVITGGLVAGVVFVVLDAIVNSTLLVSDMQALAQARNLDLAAMESASTMIAFIACDLLFGLLVVWTYAAIRPRFGPGPKTAVYAGLLLYLTAMFAVFGFTIMGLFPLGLFLKSAVVYLVVILVATLAGAWTYREAR